MLATIAATTAASIMAASAVVGQQANPVSKNPSKPARGPAVATQPEPMTPPVMSPWAKFCARDEDSNDKAVCLTSMEARTANGQLAAGVALVEREGEQRRILRVTLPRSMQVALGARAAIDQMPPFSATIVRCLPKGCMADFETNNELLDRLKKGRTLMLQAVGAAGQVVRLALPLGDFARVHEAPPNDPNTAEERQQQRLQEELEKRAEELRRRLQSAPAAADKD